jgi:heme exporter protein A
MELVAEGLGYARDKKFLFKDLTFRALSGEAFHILGPNGAGKTSLLRILAGLLFPLQGSVSWNGLPVWKSHGYKKKISYIAHRLGMKSTLTAFENLYLFLIRRGVQEGRSLKQIKINLEARVHFALQKLNLKASNLTASLSAGQKQRLVLAKLLLIKTDCWILDEPLTALDGYAVQLLSLLLKEQLEKGGIIIFSSHQPVYLPHVTIKKIFLGDKTLCASTFSY